MRIRPAILFPLLVVGVFLLRLEHRYHFRNLYIDTEVQMGAAVQAELGNGYSLPEVVVDQPDQVHQKPVRVFMPGLMRLFRLGLWTGATPYTVIWGWEALAILLWSFASLWAFSQLSNKPTLWLFGIFLAVALPPLHYLTTSGLLALALWTFSLAVLNRKEHTKLHDYLLALLACGLAAWIRTAYLPLLILPLLTLIGEKRRLTLDRNTGILLLATVGAMVGLVITSTALFSYNETIPKGFFPSHLLHLEPFTLKSFLYWGIPHEVQVAGYVGKLWPWIKGGMQLGSLLLLGFILRGAMKHVGDKNLNRFWLWTAYTSGITLGMLIYQSLRTPAETWNWIGFWTFVMEPRYFAPLMMGIILGSFFLIQASPFPGQKLLKTWVMGTLMLNVLGFVWIKGQIYVGGQIEHSFQAHKAASQLSFIKAQSDKDVPAIWLKGAGGLAPVMAGIPYVEADSLPFLLKSGTDLNVYAFEIDSTLLQPFEGLKKGELFEGIQTYVLRNNGTEPRPF